MNQDAEHLRLLSIFHYVCAGLAALCACFPVFHLIFGLVILFRPESFGTGSQRPPAVFGLFFVLFASIFILFGWTFAALLAYAGRCLGQRKHYTFCMVMGGVACMFMPFGTVLGVFTIIVLARPSVKALFNSPTPPVFSR
jgi:hypothetical protein